MRAEARALRCRSRRQRAWYKGPGGEKEHQGHEDVQQVGLDDQVGVVEHQEGDDPEEEPGEMGGKGVLFLRRRAGRTEARRPCGLRWPPPGVLCLGRFWFLILP